MGERCQAEILKVLHADRAAYQTGFVCPCTPNALLPPSCYNRPGFREPRSTKDSKIAVLGDILVVRVYISSTYNDLEEHRQAVYHALRQLGHDVVAMEDYVATDQRPLAKCLEDVATSDVYIGIFAWRYGFIPPNDNPEQHSITELEYRQAVTLSKPLFLVSVGRKCTVASH